MSEIIRYHDPSGKFVVMATLTVSVTSALMDLAVAAVVIKGGYDIRTDETKIIGIYSSYENAELVKEEYKTKQGFNKFPEDCFYIDAYELDQNDWSNGFITWDSNELKWLD